MTRIVTTTYRYKRRRRRPRNRNRPEGEGACGADQGGLAGGVSDRVPGLQR